MLSLQRQLLQEGRVISHGFLTPWTDQWTCILKFAVFTTVVHQTTNDHSTTKLHLACITPTN